MVGVEVYMQCKRESDGRWSEVGMCTFGLMAGSLVRGVPSSVYVGMSIALARLLVRECVRV